MVIGVLAGICLLLTLLLIITCFKRFFINCLRTCCQRRNEGERTGQQGGEGQIEDVQEDEYESVELRVPEAVEEYV